MPTSGIHIIRGCTRTHVHTHHHTSTWKFYGRMGTGDCRHSIILQRGLECLWTLVSGVVPTPPHRHGRGKLYALCWPPYMFQKAYCSSNTPISRMGELRLKEVELLGPSSNTWPVADPGGPPGSLSPIPHPHQIQGWRCSLFLPPVFPMPHTLWALLSLAALSSG